MHIKTMLASCTSSCIESILRSQLGSLAAQTLLSDIHPLGWEHLSVNGDDVWPSQPHRTKTSMSERDIEQLAAWVTEQALAGAPENELLDGFCQRASTAGLPISSAVAVVDTPHPIWEGSRLPLAERRRGGGTDDRVWQQPRGRGDEAVEEHCILSLA
jgi:hypothetical protein